MRLLLPLLLTVLVGEVFVTPQETVSTVAEPCEVTLPGQRSASAFATAPGFYGTKELSVSLAWPDGTVVFKPGGAGFVLPDGSLSMKFAWQRGVHGALTIGGRRLDAPAPPLRADVPSAYGDVGFQATALVFPTPGCWEISGRVGPARLTFVTKVVRIGTGRTRAPQ